MLSVTPTALALTEGVLLVLGGLAAFAWSRRLARLGDGAVALMGAVTAWFLTFGMIPFLIFAISYRSVASFRGSGSVAIFIINLIPFALVAAPLVGFVHGMKLRRSK